MDPTELEDKCELTCNQGFNVTMDQTQQEYKFPITISADFSEIPKDQRAVIIQSFLSLYHRDINVVIGAPKKRWYQFWK